LNRQKICHVCKGHGTKDPNDVKVCNECRGQGVKVVQKMIAPGFIQQFQTHCNVCGGRGKIFKSTCKSCDGKKVLRQSESIKFKVPAGAPEDFIIVSKWKS
jgi:DnaJ-related protein SCJ1